ncbi:hypothetical protein UVI_02018300 [Ustilaginoidea virens]|uniref:Uncharacterized protein n=1 Tax=Ustilaginoidea virens TaxID=1159556 RepID=A0A1B5KS99_USTVR|nr:hypothetical protein UVI_02018300 [Ustilaginoidea virens]
MEAERGRGGREKEWEWRRKCFPVAVLSVISAQCLYHGASSIIRHLCGPANHHGQAAGSLAGRQDNLPHTWSSAVPRHPTRHRRVRAPRGAACRLRREIQVDGKVKAGLRRSLGHVGGHQLGRKGGLPNRPVKLHRPGPAGLGERLHVRQRHDDAAPPDDEDDPVEQVQRQAVPVRPVHRYAQRGRPRPLRRGQLPQTGCEAVKGPDEKRDEPCAPFRSAGAAAAVLLLCLGAVRVEERQLLARCLCARARDGSHRERVAFPSPPVVEEREVEVRAGFDFERAGAARDLQSHHVGGWVVRGCCGGGCHAWVEQDDSQHAEGPVTEPDYHRDPEQGVVFAVEYGDMAAGALSPEFTVFFRGGGGTPWGSQTYPSMATRTMMDRQM